MTTIIALLFLFLVGLACAGVAALGFAVGLSEYRREVPRRSPADRAAARYAVRDAHIAALEAELGLPPTTSSHPQQ